MPIGKALLLKGLGGLAALGGAIGGAWYLYNSNQETTRFDEGLIDYLNEGGDIQFSVKDGSNSDISTTFPSFTTGTTPPTATVTIKVSVATSGTTDGTLTDATSPTPVPEKGKKETLQKLNGTGNGNAWTWVCEVKFTKKADDTTATELKDKEKLVQSSEPKGLLNKLKDADTTNNKENKKLKIKFIKDCAANRGTSMNRKINKKESLSVTEGVITKENEIKTTKTFELRKGNTASGEEATKLYPVDKSDFNYWFGITSN